MGLEISRRLSGGRWRTGAAEEGSGDGGSSSASWVGPYAFAAADYNPALGSGWDGILIEDALPADKLLLRVAYVIDVTIDNSATLNVYAGTLAGDSFGGPALQTDANSYQTELAVSGFTVTALSTNRGGLVTGAGVSQVWIDSFSAPPSVGSGRLWLELAAFTAPT